MSEDINKKLEVYDTIILAIQELDYEEAVAMLETIKFDIMATRSGILKAIENLEEGKEDKKVGEESTKTNDNTEVKK